VGAAALLGYRLDPPMSWTTKEEHGEGLERRSRGFGSSQVAVFRWLVTDIADNSHVVVPLERKRCM
jgi:hypothetical protein